MTSTAKNRPDHPDFLNDWVIITSNYSKLMEEKIACLLQKDPEELIEMHINLAFPWEDDEASKDKQTQKEYIDGVINNISPILEQNWGEFIWRSDNLGILYIKCNSKCLKKLLLSNAMKIKAIGEKPYQEREIRNETSKEFTFYISLPSFQEESPAKRIAANKQIMDEALIKIREILKTHWGSIRYKNNTTWRITIYCSEICRQVLLQKWLLRE